MTSEGTIENDTLEASVHVERMDLGSLDNWYLDFLVRGLHSQSPVVEVKGRWLCDIGDSELRFGSGLVEYLQASDELPAVLMYELESVHTDGREGFAFKGWLTLKGAK